MEKDRGEKIKQRKIMRQSTMIVLFGILVASSLTVLVVKQSPSIKESYRAAPLISDLLFHNLSAFKISDSKDYLTGLEGLSQGDELIFKVSVLRPTFIGLLVANEQQDPEFVFYTRLPPGKSRMIERQGQRYKYKVGIGGGSVKFCVVSADSKAELQQMSKQLQLLWSGLPVSSCLELK